MWIVKLLYLLSNVAHRFPVYFSRNHPKIVRTLWMGFVFARRRANEWVFMKVLKDVETPTTNRFLSIFCFSHSRMQKRWLSGRISSELFALCILLRIVQRPNGRWRHMTRGTCDLEIIQTHFLPSLREANPFVHVAFYRIIYALVGNFSHCSSIALSYQLPTISPALAQSADCKYLNVAHVLLELTMHRCVIHQLGRKLMLFLFIHQQFSSVAPFLETFHSNSSEPAALSPLSSSLWLRHSNSLSPSKGKSTVCSSKGTRQVWSCRDAVRRWWHSIVMRK